MPRANPSTPTAAAAAAFAASDTSTSAASPAQSPIGSEIAATAPLRTAEQIRPVPPLAPTHPFEPLEHQIGQDRERMLLSTGPASQAMERPRFEGVDRPVDPEKRAMLEFMEQRVEVLIHTTNDPNAEEIFDIGNNGQHEIFRRGEKKVCKRKFVMGLASSKVTTFSQERRRDDDGVMHDVQVPRTGLRYPFSVTRDDHPRGQEWLAAVLAQA